MQQDQVTLSDLRKQLNMPTIAHLIGQAKLRFLGHLARKPTESLERKILFSWLQPDNTQPAQKRGHQLRHDYWKLLEEVRCIAQKPSESWPTQWTVLASESEGISWNKLVKQWSQTQLHKDFQDTWLIRHRPGGAHDIRTEKARESAQVPGTGGKYQCPYCREEMFLRSLKKHIIPCGNLPPEQRQVLQQRRTERQQKQAALRTPAAAPHQPHPAAPAAAAAKRPNRRLVGKQAPPTSKNTPRQICFQDLPPPPPPSNWPAKQCHFCLEQFQSHEKCRKHTCSCKSTPYQMWIARVQKTQENVTVTDHPCPHCHIKFWTAHAKGRHSVVCKQRKDSEHK